MRKGLSFNRVLFSMMCIYDELLHHMSETPHYGDPSVFWFPCNQWIDSGTLNCLKYVRITEEGIAMWAERHEAFYLLITTSCDGFDREIKESFVDTM